MTPSRELASSGSELTWAVVCLSWLRVLSSASQRPRTSSRRTARPSTPKLSACTSTRLRSRPSERSVLSSAGVGTDRRTERADLCACPVLDIQPNAELINALPSTVKFWCHSQYTLKPRPCPRVLHLTARFLSTLQTELVVSSSLAQARLGSLIRTQLELTAHAVLSIFSLL